jgi:hypothetical protein
MGCCQNTESTARPQQQITRTVSISKHMNSLNHQSLNKKFSSQVDQLKSLSSFFESSLQSSLNSSSNYLSSLQSLNFYFSSKNLFDLTGVPESLTCSDCFITFDSSNQLPLCLTCGHSLCKSCCIVKFNAQGKVQCTFNCEPDTIPPESLEINSPIINKVKSLDKGLLCLEHCEATEDYCVNCKQVVCELCIDRHQKHQILNVNSQEFVKELNNWVKSLETYQNKNSDNVQLILKQRKKFEDLRGDIEDHIENHVNMLAEGVKDIKEGFIEAAEETQENLKEFVKQLNDIVPCRELDLYKDVILQELEKAKEVSDRVGSVNVKALRELGKVELKNFPKTPEVLLRPWENSLKNLQELMNDEFLLLALTSLKYA